MKIYTLIALLPIFLLSATTTNNSTISKHIVRQQAVITQGKLTPRELVRIKGEEYGVSVPLMEQIITCESNWNTTLQSRHRYTKDRPREGVKKGERELSFGLVQIHLPAHPNITKEQATDPEFAIDFLAKNIAKGKASMWTCYKLPQPIKNKGL